MFDDVRTNSWGWLFKLRIVGGAIASIVSLTVALWQDFAIAQSNIVPDNTLGAENSTVTPNFNGEPIEVINGGTQRGQNLFHSFREFNVSAGRGAYFFSPSANIQNILARVTGGDRSEILGTLGTFGNSNPNLFLINPNGIIFGRNASLDVGGSFVATTANAIGFGNQGFFNATNPNTPELLTVNPSAFLFNQIAAASIQNNSVAPAGLDPSGFDAFGLRVPDGRSLVLVGGNISMDAGQLNAFGGRVELGGLSGTGTVGLNVNNKLLSLSFPDAVTRANMSLSNRSGVDVTGENGGDIVINARSLDISGKSFLFAGIGRGLGTASSQAGDIIFNAIGTVNISDSGRIFNQVGSDSRGNGGNIRITTTSLSVNGSQLRASTSGQGNAGSVIIDASDTVSFNGSLTGAISAVLPTGKGQGGEILINTGMLSLADGAQLIASTSGIGNAGSVNINVRNSVSFDGGDDFGFVSGVFNDVNETGIGRGGGIRIRTGSLSVINGAELTSSTYGKGDAGNVIIDVRDTVSFKGLIIINGRKVSSGVFSNVQQDAEGNGGKIQITTGSLFVTDSAELDVGTFGQGDGGSVTIDARDSIFFDKSNIFSNVEEGAIGQGGNIQITTGSISFTNNAEIQASTAGLGDAGNVVITARDTISFDGVGTTEFESGIFPSGIFSEVEEKGEGKGGDIRLSTGSLSVTNGAQLVAVTRGQGDAGSFTIDAHDAVVIKGVGTNGLSSGLFTSTTSRANGQGGAIKVNTPSFRVADGAVVNAQTFNSRNGGSVTINADTFEATSGGQVITTTRNSGRAGDIILNITDKILLSGSDPTYTTRLAQFGNIVDNEGAASSGLFANTASDSTGQGGNLTINTSTLRVQDGASVTVSSPQGQAGNLTVTAKTISLNQGSLTAETAITRGEEGANIKLQGLDLLLLRNGSRISAQANGTANGGNITIDADKGFVVAFPRQDSDILASASVGRGGNIKITTQGIFGLAEGQAILGNRTNDIDASSQFNAPGTVTINTPDVDPSRGLVELPVNLVDATQQISTACTPGSRQRKGSFTAIGRGGIAPSPTEPLMSDAVLTPWVTLFDETGRDRKQIVTNVNPPNQIVEAQGWVRDANGDVFLVASVPSVTPQNTWLTSASCRDSSP